MPTATVTSDTASPSSGDLGIGQGATFTLAISEPVTVQRGPENAIPDVALNDGNTATYDGPIGTATSTLTFETAVATGDNAVPLAVTGVDLNGSTVEDQNGNAADLSGAVATFRGLDVDTTPPTVSSTTLTVAQNSGPTPVGIPAPTDNVTPTASLTATADDLPSNGILTLANGQDVYQYESLTEEQLTTLRFTPFSPQAGSTSAFTYTVSDQAGNSTFAAVTLDVLPPPPPDSVAIGPNAAFFGDGQFVLSGTVSSAAGVKSVEISARIGGVDSPVTDLGAAAVNPDGTWTFDDRVGSNLQGFITATETDDAGGTAAATADYSLRAGIRGRRYQATQTNYNAIGDLNSVAYDRADGSRTVVTDSIFQELTSQYYDTFLNGGAGDVEFVFDPGYGNDTIKGFRSFGTSHDGILLSSSDFANFAQMLQDTQNTPNGAVIHDNTSGDTILLAGITKKELSHAGADFGFIS